MGQLFEERLCMNLLMLVLILISSHLIGFVVGKERGEEELVLDELGDYLVHLPLTAGMWDVDRIAGGQRRSFFGLYSDYQLFLTD